MVGKCVGARGLGSEFRFSLAWKKILIRTLYYGAPLTKANHRWLFKLLQFPNYQFEMSGSMGCKSGQTGK